MGLRRSEGTDDEDEVTSRGQQTLSQDGHGEVYAKAGGQTACSYEQESGAETQIERFGGSR